MIYSVYTTDCAPEGGSIGFITTSKESAIAYAEAWWAREGDCSGHSGVLVEEWPDTQEWTLDYEEKHKMCAKVLVLGFRDEED